ncbi:MAG: hypothetical protein L6R38_002192 [Xanthoria sp. 2 TBL-2021]|nr:MAG: hypothetical protein L6R38_002192 [Xanthoria sp. 2 TBL-2021]
MAPAAPAPNARESKVVISPSFEKVPGSQHPWSNVEDRTFWSGRRPQRHWRKVFRRRSRPSLPPDVQIGRVSQRAVPPSSSPKGTSLSMPKKRRIQGDDGGISPCWELPGDTADSPKELATFEQGTYEEVQKELTATAREMAIQLRRKQTLQQLEQLQLDEPGIIRIRRFPSREIAELDSELPEPTELPGWEMRASSSDPASCVYELDMSDDIHEPKETTSRIAQPRDSQTEPPFSDLEAVGDPDSRGHLEEMPMIPPGSNISYSAQDIGPQDESRLPQIIGGTTRSDRIVQPTGQTAYLSTQV